MGLFSFVGDVISNIPGAKVVSNTVKGLMEEGLTGMVKGLGKGLSEDWALGLACLVIPGGQAIGLAQLGAFGVSLTGALELKSEKQAQKHTEGQSQSRNQDSPAQSPGYW